MNMLDIQKQGENAPNFERVYKHKCCAYCIKHNWKIEGKLWSEGHWECLKHKINFGKDNEGWINSLEFLCDDFQSDWEQENVETD